MARYVDCRMLMRGCEKVWLESRSSLPELQGWLTILSAKEVSMRRLLYAALFAISICCVTRAGFTQTPSPCGAQASDGRIGVASKSNFPFSVTFRSTHEQRFA